LFMAGWRRPGESHRMRDWVAVLAVRRKPVSLQNWVNFCLAKVARRLTSHSFFRWRSLFPSAPASKETAD
jgi:hypothetical protein